MSPNHTQYWDLKTAIVEAVFSNMQAGDTLTLWPQDPGWSVMDSRSGRTGRHEDCPGCAFRALGGESVPAPGKEAADVELCIGCESERDHSDVSKADPNLIKVGADCIEYLQETGGIWKLLKEENGWQLTIECTGQQPLVSQEGSLASPFGVCQAMNEKVRHRLASLQATEGSFLL